MGPPSRRAGHLVVIAPHPDDEIIAATALIQCAVRSGWSVRVVVVTDGSASHQNSISWSATRLIAERRRETLRNLRRLRIPKGSVTFLGLPDGGLRELSASHSRRVSIDLMRGRQPDIIVMPHRNDAHPDHRVCAALCDRAWKNPNRKWCYLVWPPATGSHDMKKRLPRGEVRLPANPSFKRALLAAYRTQTGLITDDPHGFSLSRSDIHRMCAPAEHFVRPC